MKNMLTIIKKELKRFFTDRRMLVSLLLPGIMIFVIYSLMGTFLAKQTNVVDDYTYKAIVVNYPDEFKTDDNFQIINSTKFELIEKRDLTDEVIFKQLTDKELDLYVIFDVNFYSEMNNETDKPEVKIYYNSSKKESATAYELYYNALDNFERSISNKFDINKDQDVKFDLATDESIAIRVVTAIIPFLLITFLFSGAMSISIESIAGEKERGTIATLLATPVKRSEIALGKIISLSLVSLVSAASSFIGLMLSLPKLIQGSDINLNIYGPVQYLLLFVVLITTTLIFVVLISLISAYSKSIKEASSFASVLMIINMMISITSMTGASTQGKGGYFIPIYNSVQSITSILNFEFDPINFLITIIVNMLIVGLGIFGLTKMFNSEKVMFNK